MQKITPFLWFNDQAEEAANFYTSVFLDSKIESTTRYGETGPGPKGSVMTVSFSIAGQEFLALNGGPQFKFSPAISFIVNCENQGEIDWYWDKLSDGGKQNECGWIEDKYGVSWQVVPRILGDMLTNADTAKAQKAMQAMFKMKKIDIEALQQAYDN